MKTLNRLLKRRINFVNTVPISNTANYTRLSLYESSLSKQLTSTELEHLNKMQSHEALKFINEREEFLKVYDEIAPCAMTAFFNVNPLHFVYKANYMQDIKMLEFFIMDTDGFYRHYVPLQDIVPITYSDTQVRTYVTYPFMDFIDPDMIYKKAYESGAYFFLKDGEWNAETASRDEFDFRNLFEEVKWIDSQIDSHS